MHLETLDEIATRHRNARALIVRHRSTMQVLLIPVSRFSCVDMDERVYEYLGVIE